MGNRDEDRRSESQRDRAPPPWRVGHNDDAYWIEDASGQRFAFTYFRDDQIVGTRSGVTLSRDLARRLASSIAMLPDLYRHSRRRK